MRIDIRATTLVTMLALVAAPCRTAIAQSDIKESPQKQPPGAPATPGSPQYQARISGDVLVGERPPDFELDGSGGKPVRLSSTRGHWVVLVFGDRKETVAPMREVAAQLDSSGIRVLGICAEKAYILAGYARAQHFPFPLLADVTREISDMYGLYDSRARFVQPGFILIEPGGKVRLALLGQTLPPEDIARLARYVATRP